MENFTLSLFSFVLKADSDLQLPVYKGSTLRGGFGHAFRRACCTVRKKDCADCIFKNQCAYSWVFETPVPDGAEMLRKYTSAPHPFVLEPPDEERRTYQPGDTLSFRLVLIGRATDYLPYFIYSFHQLGKIGIGKDRGKFEIEQVIQEDIPARESLKGKVVFESGEKTLFATTPPKAWKEIVESDVPARIRIRFLTPTRIKYKGHLTKDLEFHVLFRSMLRRISLLSYFHCGQRLDDSRFRQLIDRAREITIQDQALHWYDWNRWSNRQGTRMKMGGFMGEITYEGDFEPFWPYIRLGEYVHVGKGSSFGLGRYEVVNENHW